MNLGIGDEVRIIIASSKWNGGEERALSGQIVGLNLEMVRIRFPKGEEISFSLINVEKIEIIESKRTTSEKVFRMVGTVLGVILALIAWIIAIPFLIILWIIGSIMMLARKKR